MRISVGHFFFKEHVYLTDYLESHFYFDCYLEILCYFTVYECEVVDDIPNCRADYSVEHIPLSSQCPHKANLR